MFFRLVYIVKHLPLKKSSIKLGFVDEKYVQNALMDLYSRMGKINISKYIFDNMESKDIVSWNT